MAIDPHAPTSTESAAPIQAADSDLASSPLENEIPTYRAISPLAVASLVFGLIGGLAFADWMFLAASVLAILLGALALWRIKQQPEILTGHGFAQAGIALGLVFGLSSVTIDFTQRLVTARNAERFLRGQVIEALDTRSKANALWLQSMPETRRGMTPEQILQEFNQKVTSDPMFRSMNHAARIITITELLEKNPQAKVKFEGIERTGYDGITPIAIGLMKIEGLEHDDHADGHEHSPEEEVGREYIGVLVKATGDAGNQSWWVDEYQYPYVPHSFKERMKPVDDGHGHGH